MGIFIVNCLMLRRMDCSFRVDDTPSHPGRSEKPRYEIHKHLTVLNSRVERQRDEMVLAERDGREQQARVATILSIPTTTRYA